MTQAHRLLLKWARTLHVYLTLFGLVLLLFFAITGFMLNHESWFLPQDTTLGQLPTDLVSTPENRDAIVEKAREQFSLQGDVDSFEFENEKDHYRIVFKTEESSANVLINRADGQTQVIRENSGAVEQILEGKMPLELLDPWEEAKKLPVVEKLRKDFAVKGEMSSFDYEKESESFRVVFKAPGYLATANIQGKGEDDSKHGHTRVTHQWRGVAGLVLDLHRGKDSGMPWSIVIDGVSILFVMVSLTGLILWSSLRGRAQYGLAVIALGLGVSLVVYFAYVPR